MRIQKRFLQSIGLGLLLAAAMAWPGHAGEHPQEQLPAAAADKPAWSATINGLRARLSAPAAAHYQAKTLLPLLVEVQNDSKEPIPCTELWKTVRVLAHDDKGNWLGIPAMGPQIGNWAVCHGNIAPGEIVEEKIPLQSLRFNRPIKAGETIQLQVSAPTQQQRTGQLPLEANSPAVQIHFDAAFPQDLADTEIAPDWNLELAYENSIGLLGSQTLQIDAHGTAMLIDDLQHDGHRNNRRMSIKLSPERLRQISADLKKIEVWKLAQVNSEPAGPDEAMIRLSIAAPTGGSVAGAFASRVETRQPVVREFRQLMEGVVNDIEALDAGRK